MRRLFPYPLLWVALFVMWLLLNNSVSPGHLLLGALIATLAARAVAPLEPPKPKIGNIGAIFALLGALIADIVVSNLAVIGLLLGRRRPRSVFVNIPLALKDPNALAVLAAIVTATPGSAWVHYDSLRSRVTIHVLDTPDGDAWAATLKRTYEARLLEIFQ